MSEHNGWQPPRPEPSATPAPPPDTTQVEHSQHSRHTQHTQLTQPAPLPSADTGEDPYRWLEDIDGERAAGFVRSANAHTEATLTGSTRYRDLHREILEVLDAQDRIPLVTARAGLLYNFWTDAEHERGVWRRTPPESYASEAPVWEVLLDLDALNAEEGASWVWKGADVLYPSATRALVHLSPGGTDATEVREFDLTTKTFVADGFRLPPSKGGAHWADATGSAILLNRDTGEGSLTRSGYPRTVRRWERGTPLTAAPLLFEGAVEDVGISVWVDHTPGFERTIIHRAPTFYTAHTHLLGAEGTTLLPVPESAEVDLHREWLIVLLRETWELPHQTHGPGTLLGIRLAAFLDGSRDFAVLFEPSATTSLLDATWTRSHLVLTLLDDVRHRIDVLTPPIAADAPAATATPAPSPAPVGPRAWRRRPGATRAMVTTSAEADGGEGQTPADPFPTFTVLPVDARENDQIWCLTEGFLTPPTLVHAELDEKGTPQDIRQVKASPARFDATGLAVTQHFVASADGTRIPYFQIGAAPDAGSALGGPAVTADSTEIRPQATHPTLLYGYGGFEVSQLPSYLGAVGRAWLARGGVYVVANIRGGGEYGPQWHRAALRENRHRAYEDFAAVARDLVDRGVTTPQQLGARGGSNGGLLMGNMLTGYPEHFGAIVCQVPLLDMKRYSHLLAGASWMAEYGDPDDPADWEFLQGFSPYHRVRPETPVPPTLLTTSTRDDRVHPGHARKMAALLTDLGKDVLFWENTEGGHGGAASNAERATMNALAYEFLWTALG